jgi:hypothetical protein
VPADPAFDAAVAQARSVYDQLGPWIDRYHGGLPFGFLVAAISHESGGNFGAPGDPMLGEVGYLQVAHNVPGLFGYPPEARMDPESNIAIGVLEYELEAVLWMLAFPQVHLGTDDSWLLARLAFAIGRGGSHGLATLAAASVGLSDGDVYGSIVRYIQLSGGVPLGSQSAQKVASRVLDIERQWQVGKAIGGISGPPVRIPDPPAGPYTLPADVEPYFSEAFPATMLIIGGMAIVAYLLYQRRKR